MIKGMTIVLYEHTQTGTDGFNHPVYTETPVEVNDVLVTPASSDDIVNELQLTGKKLVYTLCIPKGDTHAWEDSKVEFFGKSFRTFGLPEEYIEDNVPLRWNKKIKVERYE